MNFIETLNELFSDKITIKTSLNLEFTDKDLLNRLSPVPADIDNIDDLEYYIENFDLSSNGENYTGILLDIRRKTNKFPVNNDLKYEEITMNEHDSVDLKESISQDPSLQKIIAAMLKKFEKQDTIMQELYLRIKDLEKYIQEK